MFKDGDIYMLPDDLVFCSLDKEKNKIVVKDYLSGEVFCTEKKLLSKKKKSYWGNIHKEEGLSGGFIYDSIFYILKESFLETSIKKVLKMPRWTFTEDENWAYFRIKIIKRLYNYDMNSDYWRLNYEILNSDLIRFLEKDLELENTTDLKKISILESILF